MLILYRFLTCSEQCSNWIPPCSEVLRILLGRESKRGLCSWTTVRTWYLFQSFYMTALHLGINQHATIGYGKTSALFLSWIFTGFLGYYQSGMLLTSHYTFEKPVFIPAVLTTELFISWPILPSCEKEAMVRFHPLQTFWSLGITNSLSDSGWWHWVISEWKWSSAHSLVSPAELALNPVLKNALLSNSRYLWKAPQLHEYFFSRKSLKK